MSHISAMKSSKVDPQNPPVENSDEREFISSPFVEGEKVLAYHGPLIYTAKIQKIELKEEKWIYFLHYSGWSKNWDEWVGDERLLKYTDANVAEQQRLNAEKNAKSIQKGKTSSHQKSSDSKQEKDEKVDSKASASKGKKRKSEPGFEENETASHGHLSIPLSKELRDLLIFDFAQVSKGMLVPVPRKPNVSDILDKFVTEHATVDSSERDCVIEMACGLKSYFDRSLPLLLLYKQERNQYLSLFGDDSHKLPSKVYGAEHLLRLFTELPELFGYVKLEEEAKLILTRKLSEFLDFLQKNQNQFFLNAYEIRSM